MPRFAAAAQDGFQAVEYLFPYAFAAQDLARCLTDSGLQQVLFNAPPGDWDAGERGLACLPGRDVLIEPINTRDIPGYFLNRQDEAHAIVQRIGAPNLKVQFDLYHCQIVEGDLASKIRQYLPTGRVGHFQIAGVPQRHEPSVGELNYTYLFQVIDEVAAQCGWSGWVGCEYRPALGAVRGATSTGLAWMQTNQ